MHELSVALSILDVAAEEAERHYLEALCLSPRDVAAHHWMSSAGTSKLHLAKDEEAVAWFRRAIDAYKPSPRRRGSALTRCPKGTARNWNRPIFRSPF